MRKSAGAGGCPCHRTGVQCRQQPLLYAAEHGAVLVSPCISPGEKQIAHAALDAGHPLIVLVENGFRPHYKPPGKYFDTPRGRGEAAA